MMGLKISFNGNCMVSFISWLSRNSRNSRKLIEFQLDWPLWSWKSFLFDLKWKISKITTRNAGNTTEFTSWSKWSRSIYKIKKIHQFLKDICFPTGSPALKLIRAAKEHMELQMISTATTSRSTDPGISQKL